MGQGQVGCREAVRSFLGHAQRFILVCMLDVAHEVCLHFPATAYRVQSLAPPPRPGYSGAIVFEVFTDVRRFCLKAWPADKVAEDRLGYVHTLQRRAAKRLPFIPDVHDTCVHVTSHLAHGFRWELSDWMPGEADFHAHPTMGRLRAAMTALGRLHEAWSQEPGTPQSCPALQRCSEKIQLWRLETQRLIEQALHACHHPLATQLHPLPPLINRLLPRVEGRLVSYLACAVPVFPVLRDVWHDHVLYVGHEVTGLIDFGAVNEDSPAADLARLLGSLVGRDVDQFGFALDVYRQLRPLSRLEEMLVWLLDLLGVIVAAINWLCWLLLEKREYAEWPRLAARITTVRERLEDWKERRPANLIREP